MNEIYMTNETSGIAMSEVESCMDQLLEQYPDLKKVLIIPPDFTRCYSYAGEITQVLYQKLGHTYGHGCRGKRENVCRSRSRGGLPGTPLAD